jgi:hypothetical protein
MVATTTAPFAEEASNTPGHGEHEDADARSPEHRNLDRAHQLLAVLGVVGVVTAELLGPVGHGPLDGNGGHGTDADDEHDGVDDDSNGSSPHTEGGEDRPPRPTHGALRRRGVVGVEQFGGRLGVTVPECDREQRQPERHGGSGHEQAVGDVVPDGALPGEADRAGLIAAGGVTGEHGRAECSHEDPEPELEAGGEHRLSYLAM